jgi:hypothetical protein
MLWMFAIVQKYQQIPTFPFYGRSACSLLFRGVVVKLSSTGIMSKLAFYNRRGLSSTAVADKKLLVPTNCLRRTRFYDLLA